MDRNGHDDESRHGDGDINNDPEPLIVKALTAYETRSRRSRRVSFAVAVVWSLLAVAGVLYLLEGPRSARDTFDEIAERHGGSDPPLIGSSIKKAGAEVGAGDGEVDAASAAATVVGSELANLTEYFGATDTLYTIVRGRDTWTDYAIERDGSDEFALQMAALRALGLVEFDGNNYAEATPTIIGLELSHLTANAQTQFSHAAPVGQTDSVESALPSGAPDVLLEPLSGRIGGEREALATPSANPQQLDIGGVSVEGEIGSVGPTQRWYGVTVDTPDLYVFRTSRPEGAEQMDTVIRLLNRDGEEIGYDDDAGDGLYSLLRERLPPGEYRLGVAGYDGMPGRFVLSVATHVVDVERQRQRQREVLSTASLLRPNGGIEEGMLDGESDAWYKIDVENAGRYIIATAAPDEGNGVDTVIRLYDDSGMTLLGEDDDGRGTYYSELTEELADDTYYVRVSSFWRRGGAFTIGVSSDEPK